MKKLDRERIAIETHLSYDRILYLLQLSDLLRINGVGPAYARVLIKIGILGVRSYRETASEYILKKYQEINDKEKLINANLGIKDIEYCRRFCEKLDLEIE